MKEKIVETIKNLGGAVTLKRLYHEMFDFGSPWFHEREIEKLLEALRELNKEGRLRLADFKYSSYEGYEGGNFYIVFGLTEES